MRVRDVHVLYTRSDIVCMWSLGCVFEWCEWCVCVWSINADNGVWYAVSSRNSTEVFNHNL